MTRRRRQTALECDLYVPGPPMSEPGRRRRRGSEAPFFWLASPELPFRSSQRLSNESLCFRRRRRTVKGDYGRRTGGPLYFGVLA